MSRGSTQQPNFAILFVLACVLVGVQVMAQFWAATAYTLPDTDDALRLVQVRAFLAGQGWFDLHQARFDPPAGYDSHWSRLIDAGLAGLFIAFKSFVDAPLAERLMAGLWPIMWLVPMIGATAAIAWRLAGREAACAALLLAVFGLPGMGQFRPGRIDHHNVQIALAALAVAATVWSDRKPWAAWAAGAVTGLALAIGLEGLPILALCGAAHALCFVLDHGAAARARAYGLSLAGATAAAFLVSVGPDHWTVSVCDELAINSTAAVVAASLGLAAISLLAVPQPPWRRAAALLAVAALAAAAGLSLEPRCIGGPFAMTDPTVRTLWLNRISEMQSLANMLRVMPLSGVAEAAFPAVGLIATLVIARELRRDFGFLVAAAAFLLALAIMIEVNKYYAYALWLAAPLVAVAAMAVLNRLDFRSLVTRFVAIMLVTPMSVTLGAMSIATAAGTAEGIDINPPDRQACVRMQNYAALARLPVGLLIADQLEWGPYLLAWTPHSVLAGPYHRMAASILTSHRVFALPPQEARGVLAGTRADYLVTCGAQGPLGLSDTETAASLWGHLHRGEVPDWLEAVADLPGQPFGVYRVKR
jgi:hypothetical protein